MLIITLFLCKKIMNLTNIWENFDMFSKLCLMSGTHDTKHKIKIQLTFFDEKNEFDGDWKNLFNDILTIFCNDKKIAYKFDYPTKEYIQSQQFIFSKINSTSYGVRKSLFNNLCNTHRVTNENGDVQYFNSQKRIW